MNPDLEEDRKIADKLHRAWPAFFEKFGRLTDVQRKVIPLILDGKNILICSATATGKTEAVCAPLFEKNIDCNSPWTILYICPTRALVNDLYERLWFPFSKFGLKLIRRTGDHRKKTDTIVCFATSTLEIGIDIGDIDLIVLDKPSHDVPALLQRIGRGNRRTNKTKVMLCGSNKSDDILHNAMIEAAKNGYLKGCNVGHNYSVAMQQIASYIFQSPTIARKEKTLRKFLESCILPDFAESIIDSMKELDALHNCEYGLRLGQYLLDLCATGEIHSNIKSIGGYTVIDELSGEKIATNIDYVTGKGLKTGGESYEIKKIIDYNIEVRKSKDITGEWEYKGQRIFHNASQAIALREYLNIKENIWPIVHTEKFSYVFHLGGTIRETIIKALANINGRVSNLKKEKTNAFFMTFFSFINKKPDWINNIGIGNFELYIPSKVDWFEAKLCRPYVNRNLSVDIRTDEIKSWLNIDEEIENIRKSVWIKTVDAPIKDILIELLEYSKEVKQLYA